MRSLSCRTRAVMSWPRMNSSASITRARSHMRRPCISRARKVRAIGSLALTYSSLQGSRGQALQEEAVEDEREQKDGKDGQDATGGNQAPDQLFLCLGVGHQPDWCRYSL